MPLILRVDVDKPYGSTNLIQRIASKLVEDYWFPIMHSWGYLHTMIPFMDICREYGVKGTFYFRNCTVPTQKLFEVFEADGHILGFHAEDTRSIETFKAELKTFKEAVANRRVDSFSKHGSGVHKLGKKHYAPYEPDNYREWAKILNLNYPTGNDICQSRKDFENFKGFYPKIFWIEPEYRLESLNRIEDIIEIAKIENVPILIHPTNYCARKEVRSEFQKLLNASRSSNISWIDGFNSELA